MHVPIVSRWFAVSLVAVLLTLPVAPASAATAAPIGPKAVVEGRLAGPVKVTVRLLANDAIRLCVKKSGSADAVARWATVAESGKHRRSVYRGTGCSRFGHSFAAGTTVRFRACFADPRHPAKLYCGRWRHASAA